MTIQPELATARLRLRRPQRADAARIAELADDHDVARMTTRMPHPYARSDADAFLAGLEGRREVVMLVEDADGPVGMLGFHEHALGPELGYWIGRPFWGRGYATEAAAAALRWADEAWRRKVVVSGHFADNPASGRVLEKSGFLYTGVVEPRFSLARGEPAATRMMVRLA
jgi:RimJ/RimL family protein N-acetyltransferase